jgi:hypothetical protein
MIFFVLLLCGILFLGGSFTSLFKCKLSWWERVGLAYGLGLGILTFGMFLFSLTRAPFNQYTLALVFLVWLTVIWYVRKKKRIKLDLKIHWDRPSLPAITLGVVILFVSLVSLFKSVVRPIYTWDALAIWAVKGKAIFSLGTIQAVKDYGAYPHYPLNIPITMALFYHFGEPFVKSIFPFYFMAMLMVFYGSLKRHGCGYIGSAGILMLALTPFVFSHSTIAYANLPMAFYYTSSVIYLYQFFQNNNRAFLTLSSILVGVGCWTRPDGLIWLFPNLTILVVYALKRRQWVDPILYLGPVLAFFVPWSAFTKYIIERNSPYLGYALKSITQFVTMDIETSRIKSILHYFYQQIQNYSFWGYIWPFFFFVLILYSTKIRKYSYLLALIGLDVLILFFIYYTAPETNNMGMNWWLKTGFNRITLHFFPIILFQTILLISEDIRRYHKQKVERRV